QTVDLGEGRIDRLGVERTAPFEERLLVTEVTDVRAAPRHDDRVGNEVQPPLDQIAPDRRDSRKRAHARSVEAFGLAAAQISEELRPRILPGAQKDRVRM